MNHCIDLQLCVDRYVFLKLHDKSLLFFIGLVIFFFFLMIVIAQHRPKLTLANHSLLERADGISCP